MRRGKALTMYKNMLSKEGKVVPYGHLKDIKFDTFEHVISYFMYRGHVDDFSGGGDARTARDIWLLCRHYFSDVKYHEVLQHLCIYYAGWYCYDINRRVWGSHSRVSCELPTYIQNSETGQMTRQIKAFKELDL